MNIRKHWKKILLSSTALFWASCGGDSESTSIAGGTNNEEPITPDSIVNPDDLDGIKIDTLYGIRPVYNADSGSVTSTCNCDTVYVEDTTAVEPSSSDNVKSSSSDAEQSSSSKTIYAGYGPYKLARDTSITCEVSETQTFIMGSGKQSPNEIMDDLENNKTRSIEELIKLEDKLEFESLGYGTLYGVPATSTGIKPSKYTCSNDSTYSASTLVGSGNMLYSYAEYKEKYPDPVPSPLCQKTDFMSNGITEEIGVHKESFVGDMITEYNTDKQALVDSTKTANGESLTDTQKQCLDNDVHGLSEYAGPIATKQICDGDTTVNPRYQAKLDSNKAYVRKQINKCLSKDD